LPQIVISGVCQNPPTGAPQTPVQTAVKASSVSVTSPTNALVVGKSLKLKELTIQFRVKGSKIAWGKKSAQSGIAKVTSKQAKTGKYVLKNLKSKLAYELVIISKKQIKVDKNTATLYNTGAVKTSAKVK
jgi:hypothetical protein